MIKLKSNFKLKSLEIIKSNIQFNKEFCSESCKYNHYGRQCKLFKYILRNATKKYYIRSKECKTLFFKYSLQKHENMVTRIKLNIPTDLVCYESDLFYCNYYEYKNKRCILFDKIISSSNAERCKACFDLFKKDYI